MSSLVTRYLRSTIQHRSVASVNVNGEPTYGTAADVRARVEARVRTVRTVTGDLAQSDTTLFVEPDLSVALGDQFYVDGAWRRVEAFAAGPGLTGTKFQEVYLVRIK